MRKDKVIRAIGITIMFGLFMFVIVVVVVFLAKAIVAAHDHDQQSEAQKVEQAFQALNKKLDQMQCKLQCDDYNPCTEDICDLQMDPTDNRRCNYVPLDNYESCYRADMVTTGQMGICKKGKCELRNWHHSNAY